MSIHRWMDKENGIPFSLKGILQYVTTQMGLEGITLNDIRHSQNDKHCKSLLTWGSKIVKFREWKGDTVITRSWREGGIEGDQPTGNPLQCSCLENPRDGGAWWAAVYGVTQSRTRPKWLSSSSSSSTGNYIQYLLITYSGIQSEKNNFAVHLKLIQCCKSIKLK